MLTKIVYRLLGPQNELLGWTEGVGEARGDGLLRAQSLVEVEVDTQGLITSVSVHWCDVNVEIRNALKVPQFALRGFRLAAYAAGDPIMKIGDVPQNLPAVTLKKSVRVEVPTGQLNAVGR